MAKEKITDKLQAKFDKPHFQSGSAVFFSWLGSKKYGYVTAFKKTNWGIQYTVQSTTGTSYPCGISIDGTTTSYKVGVIYLEETKKLEILTKTLILARGKTVDQDKANKVKQVEAMSTEELLKMASEGIEQ